MKYIMSLDQGTTSSPRFFYDRFEEKQDFYDKAIADILATLV